MLLNKPLRGSFSNRKLIQLFY